MENENKYCDITSIVKRLDEIYYSKYGNYNSSVKICAYCGQEYSISYKGSYRKTGCEDCNFKFQAKQSLINSLKVLLTNREIYYTNARLNDIGNRLTNCDICRFYETQPSQLFKYKSKGDKQIEEYKSVCGVERLKICMNIERKFSRFNNYRFGIPCNSIEDKRVQNIIDKLDLSDSIKLKAILLKIEAKLKNYKVNASN